VQGFEEAGADRVIVRLATTRQGEAMEELERMAQRVIG
jgi:hypothetical protein